MTAPQTSFLRRSQTEQLLDVVTGLNPRSFRSANSKPYVRSSPRFSTPASTMSSHCRFCRLELALGLVGIYGLLSFLGPKRTLEIGIRIALGAQAPSFLLLVLLMEGAKFFSR